MPEHDGGQIATERAPTGSRRFGGFRTLVFCAAMLMVIPWEGAGMDGLGSENDSTYGNSVAEWRGAGGTSGGAVTVLAAPLLLVYPTWAMLVAPRRRGRAERRTDRRAFLRPGWRTATLGTPEAGAPYVERLTTGAH